MTDYAPKDFYAFLDRIIFPSSESALSSSPSEKPASIMFSSDKTTIHL